MAKKVFIFIFVAFSTIAVLNSCNSDDSDPNGKNPDPDDSELPTPEPENPEPPKEGTFNYTLNELNTWKDKYDDLYKRYRRLQMRKRYKPVKKVVVEKEELKAEEKKIKRLAEKPVSEKEYKINTIAESTLNFLREKSISLELLSCITRLNAIPKLMKKELQLTNKHIYKGEDLGLLSGEYVGAIQNKKYYYITPKGRELVKEYIEYIKKSKSSLI